MLEIGIGTGQATKPIVETGCNLIAVELGNELSELTRQKFKRYNNISVVNSLFEDFSCSDSYFDFIYTAEEYINRLSIESDKICFIK